MPPDLIPGVQDALCARQKPVRWSRSRKAPAIEIALQRENDTTHVCVVTRAGHQTGLTQNFQWVAQLRQPTAQATSGRVADPHVFTALDAATGKAMWHFNTGDRISASPITYSFKGRQYIAIERDRTLWHSVCRRSLGRGQSVSPAGLTH